MSIAITIGRGIGYAAAATAHGAIVAANASGQFGKDVITGTQAGYADHSARLAELRANRPAPTAMVIETVAPKGRRTARA